MNIYNCSYNGNRSSLSDFDGLEKAVRKKLKVEGLDSREIERIVQNSLDCRIQVLRRYQDYALSKGNYRFAYILGRRILQAEGLA